QAVSALEKYVLNRYIRRIYVGKDRDYRPEDDGYVEYDDDYDDYDEYEPEDEDYQPEDLVDNKYVVKTDINEKLYIDVPNPRATSRILELSALPGTKGEHII